MPASGPRGHRCWTARGRVSWGSPTAISAQVPSWAAGSRPGPASSCANTPAIRGWRSKASGARGRIATGQVREQIVEIEGQPVAWRRIELALDVPTENGETTIRLWSNLPGAVSAGRIGELYRTRWRIEPLFGRLESVLHSEITSLGHPRAALLGFAIAVLAYNVLALLGRCVEQAHAPRQAPNKPLPAVSTFHLARQIKRRYEGLLIAVPPEPWPSPQPVNPVGLAERLLTLARRINPSQVATSKRKPKPKTPKGYVDGNTARAHVATARILAQASTTP
jgi:hypothetical protein